MQRTDIVQTEDEFYDENSHAVLDLIERSMLKRLDRSVDKFLFLYIFILNHTYRDAADVLGVSLGKVQDRVHAVRASLVSYRKGYSFTKSVDEIIDKASRG